MSILKSTTLPPELQLLLCCATTSLDSSREAWRDDIIARPLDWKTVVERARVARVVPLLYKNLIVVAGQVPTTVLAELRTLSMSIAQSNLAMTGELLRLLQDFAEAGVDAMPIKGPVLASMAYGDTALRAFDDLDILVQLRDVSAAIRILQTRGYTLKEHTGISHQHEHLRRQHHFSFVRGEYYIELHFAFADRFFAFPIDENRVWQRATAIWLARLEICVPATEDQLVFLCAHAASHCWERLGWICDISELLRSNDTIDLVELLKHQRAKGGERLLLLGLYLSYALVGAVVPLPIIRQAEQDGAVQTLACQVVDRLAYGSIGKLTLANITPFFLQARERWRDRARYCVRLVFSPTEGEWLLLALPAWLSWLYYLIRPFRLAWTYRPRIYWRT